MSVLVKEPLDAGEGEFDKFAAVVFSVEAILELFDEVSSLVDSRIPKVLLSVAAWYIDSRAPHQLKGRRSSGASGLILDCECLVEVILESLGWIFPHCYHHGMHQDPVGCAHNPLNMMSKRGGNCCPGFAQDW